MAESMGFSEFAGDQNSNLAAPLTTDVRAERAATLRRETGNGRSQIASEAVDSGTDIGAQSLRHRCGVGRGGKSSEKDEGLGEHFERSFDWYSALCRSVGCLVGVGKN